VTDLNDHSPSVNIEALSPVEGRATTPEAAAVGSFVAHVIVSDADAGANGRISCQLEGQDSSLFRLQSVSQVRLFAPAFRSHQWRIQIRIGEVCAFGVICHRLGMRHSTRSKACRLKAMLSLGMALK